MSALAARRTGAAGRRGPRADLDVRAEMIGVAERMFGDLTVDAVSLRAVAREAGVTARSVTYHFPTKRDLVAAVIRRRSAGVAVAVAAGLELLGAAGEPVRTRAVVEAVLQPFVDVLREHPRDGVRWLKTFTRLALAEDQIWLEELGADPGMTELFVRTAGVAIPGLDTECVRQRVGIAMFSMITALAGSDLAAYGRPLGPDGLDPQWVEQLVAFTSAGLEGTGR